MRASAALPEASAVDLPGNPAIFLSHASFASGADLERRRDAGRLVESPRRDLDDGLVGGAT